MAGPGGPLERFLSLFGTVFDSIKTDIERLLDNYDVADVQIELLPYIDALIGWDTNFELTGGQRRLETLNAVNLYKRKGRPDATETFVENIANWDVTLHEGWHHVFFSNTESCKTPIPASVPRVRQRASLPIWISICRHCWERVTMAVIHSAEQRPQPMRVSAVLRSMLALIVFSLPAKPPRTTFRA